MMKDTSYILEAVDLLIAREQPKPKPRWWIWYVDLAATVLYLGALVYTAYRILAWLS